jgi:hypothetical protein
VGGNVVDSVGRSAGLDGIYLGWDSAVNINWVKIGCTGGYWW